MIIKSKDCKFIKPYTNEGEEAEVISIPVRVTSRFTDEQIFDLIIGDKLPKDDNFEEIKQGLLITCKIVEKTIIIKGNTD